MNTDSKLAATAMKKRSKITEKAIQSFQEELDQRQNEEIKEVFNLFDVERKGVINGHNMKICFKTLGIEMKQKEGNELAKDMQARIKDILNKVEKVSELSTGLIEDYVVKLRERIKEILKSNEVDKQRLEQEVVIYADKCSVEEEITRLNSHISQFRKLLESDGAIGKKLDFLIQEMNRETNTIGSKANNLEITNNVVDVKTELENIREQIQNIE